jgi:Ca-activated chloride channel family protein
MFTRALGLALALGAAATCGHNPEAQRGVPIVEDRELAESRLELASFVEIKRPSSVVTPRVSLDAALAGTATGPGADLGSRMQVRELEIPRPPAGASTRFNFAGTRRGWVAALPKGDVLPTPAFAAGKVFISGGFGSRQFFAFDAYSGEPAWALTAEDGGPSAAIVDDGLVVFNAESCKIFVADAKTGELKWKKWLGDPLMSVPVSAGGVVMTAFPLPNGHAFVGLELETGKELWRLGITDDIIRAPQVHGDSVYFATMDGRAWRVRRSDGKELWSKDVGATSAMWVEGDRVLVSRKVAGKTTSEQPIALSIETGAIVKKGRKRLAGYFAGKSRDRQLVHAQAGAWGQTRHPDHLGLRNVAAGWAFQGSSPVVAAGRSYLAIAGDIVATDMASGARLWQRSYKQAGDAQAVTPPAVVGSQLVFGTVDGHLYFADIDTGMAIRAYDVGEAIVSQPIVAQGWVYLTTAKGRVIGLELADPMFDGWHMWGGNPTHTGLVAGAGAIDPNLLASLERPGRGTVEIDGGGELPMVDSRVAATISGTVARVELSQRFTNPGKESVEAVYRFPLPDDAAVDRMEMRIGERVIRAEIKKKNVAKKTYAKAKAAGKKAALLEQQRPDLFSQRIANIGPGETIAVSIGYVHEVAVDDGAYTFRFPMVARRRAGDDEPQPSGAVDVSVAIDAGVAIAELRSPTHEIASEIDGRRAEVSMADRRGERDFELRYVLGSAAPTAAVHAHRGDEVADGGYLALMIHPPTAPAASQIADREVIVALDTSASMAGRPLEQARGVATRLLTSLRPGDRFNVMWSGVRLADQPLAASAANINRAVARLDKITAGGRGALMLPILESALRSPATGRTRIVCAITDGFIGDEAAVLRSIASELGSARLYPVGVGSAQNRLVLERAAEIGRGRALSAPLSAEPADVAAELLARIDRPVFTDVEIDWGGLEVTDVYPRSVPDLFAGRPLVLRGRFAKGGAATVKIRGNVGARRYERSLQITLPDRASDAHSAQKTLWARAAIRDRMNRLYLRDDDAVIAEITELGLLHRLVTQWTSFVAVDDGAEPAANKIAAAPQATVTVSPATALPGDPEIRVPAPRDARAVTVVLPFGETLSATYDHELSVWTARFLIPSDAADGSYPIEVITTLADGSQKLDRVWYEVDSSAPLVEVEVVGDPRPGETVTLRATQKLTRADRRRANGQKLTDARIQLLSDARRVSARGPGGEVVRFSVAAPGVWEASYAVPASARGELVFSVVVADLAANIRTQRFAMQVAR